MTDYTELIRSLRNCSNNRCAPCDCGWFDKYQVNESCKEIIMWKAAAAIEELQAEVKAKESSKQRWKRLATDTADYVDVVRCGECKWYDPLEKSRPFFCPVMDCVNGVMEDDYCSRGELRANIEVQE